MSRTLMLSSQTVQDYAQLGAVVLRGVLNAEELQTLEQGIEHNLSHLSPLAQVASRADDPASICSASWLFYSIEYFGTKPCSYSSFYKNSFNRHSSTFGA